jgi:hypothetical protein
MENKKYAKKMLGIELHQEREKAGDERRSPLLRVRIWMDEESFSSFFV